MNKIMNNLLRSRHTHTSEIKIGTTKINCSINNRIREEKNRIGGLTDLTNRIVPPSV